jgi:hypothetical protein
MPRPRRLHPWLASLLGFGWLLGLALPGAHAGGFRVAEPRPRAPRAAALWHHPQVAEAIRVWTAVATELFRLPTDVSVTPAPCGRIDGFYDPVQQQLHLCEELLTYYAGVLTPPGGDPRTPAPVVRDATLVSVLHLMGHAVVAVLHLPVPAEIEEAADAVGMAFLAAGSPEDERTVLAGSAALVQRNRAPEPPHLVPWWAHHPWTDTRAAHLRCLLAGSHPPSAAPGLTDPPTPPCREAWQRWLTRLTPSLRLAAAPPKAAPPPPSPPPPRALAPRAVRARRGAAHAGGEPARVLCRPQRAAVCPDLGPAVTTVSTDTFLLCGRRKRAVRAVSGVVGTGGPGGGARRPRAGAPTRRGGDPGDGALRDAPRHRHRGTTSVSPGGRARHAAMADCRPDAWGAAPSGPGEASWSRKSLGPPSSSHLSACTGTEP